MTQNITDIFGTEIRVVAQPARVSRQYTGFPAAYGLTAMWLGTRGQPLIIAGRLTASGADYATARAALQVIVDTIAAYCDLDAADYYYAGTTWLDVVWDRMDLIRDSQGKAFHWCKGGYCYVDFTMTGRSIYL